MSTRSHATGYVPRLPHRISVPTINVPEGYRSISSFFPKPPPPPPPLSSLRHLEPPQQSPSSMKILTTNFLTCAVKTCKVSAASFPLHFKQAELVEQEMDFNPLFIRNILPRVDWDALRVTVTEVLSTLGGGFFWRIAVPFCVPGRISIPVMDGGIDSNNLRGIIVHLVPAADVYPPLPWDGRRENIVRSDIATRIEAVFRGRRFVDSSAKNKPGRG